MAAPGGRVAGSAGLATASAFLWATYYVFVLWLTPAAGPAALLAFPFLVGGVAYVAWAAAAGQARRLFGLFATPSGWLRTGLIVAMQLSVLGSTYLAGPVDTALLSLVGDVALTPVFLVALYGEGRDRVRTAPFLSGMALSVCGATLTIVAGGEVRPLTGVGWLAAVAVPVSVALYFLASARASISIPTSAVVGQATLGGGFVALALAATLPGSFAGLLVPSYTDAFLVVALGLTSFFVAPVLYFKAIERTGILLPALLMAAIPVFTLVLASAILRTVPPWLGIVGIPVAVGGAVVALQGSHAPWTPTYLEIPPSRDPATEPTPGGRSGGR